MKNDGPGSPSGAEPAGRRAGYQFVQRGYGRPLPPIEPHVFLDERDRAFHPEAPTGLILLDRSGIIQANFPATTPGILAAYLVVRQGEQVDTAFASSGVVGYVLKGEGQTNVVGE